MNIKIEIPFDENTFVKQSMLRWTLVNGKTRRNTKSILIGWTIVFVIGLLAGIEDNQYINGLIIVSIVFLVYGLWVLIALVRGRNKYKKELSIIAADFKKRNEKATYEFTDKYFRYVDNQREIKLDWDTFHSYAEKDNNLFLNQTDSFDYSYILGQLELVKENYDTLKIFLTSDLKLKEKEV